MNSVELVGRITKAPELVKSQQGVSICRFTLAVNRIKKVEGQPDADFISCVAFGNTADFLSNYVHKGYLLSVEGRLQTGNYTNTQTNQKVYTTDVLCSSVQNLTPRDKNEVVSSQPSPDASSEYDGMDISSDDLPF